MLRSLSAIALLAAGTVPLMAQRWEKQFFYDKPKSSLTITDLKFPSAKRGIAVGFIENENSRRTQGTSILTNDGGAHWQLAPLKETPVSLFFLNESLGWMVTTKGLWQTTEAGKNWIKLPKLPPDIVRVYFTNETTGWAVGGKKTVVATTDGGKTWTKVAAAAEPPGDPKYSAYTWIGFATPQFGMIMGFNEPPRIFGAEFPDWMDPAETLRKRDYPHLNYSLITHDGGKTWHATSASLFGEGTRVRLDEHGTGLGLVEYSQSFRYPSEVYKIDWRSGKSDTVLKDPKIFVSDIWLMPDGTSYLAGTVSQGRLRTVVPGRVEVLTSRDFGATGWTHMKVDYRAEGIRTTLTAADPQNIWLATDSGMILKLVQ